MRRILILAGLCAFVFLLTTERLIAIPAFARKYDMSCNVCHSPVPKLKPFGEEFAANGFQLPDKEPPRFTRETGDDKLVLMRELPLAIRMDGYARYRSNNDPENDFQLPYILKILSGGTIAKDVSYYFYFLFNERGDIAGVEDALLTFNDLWSTGVGLTVGQYQVSDPMFKRETRPTFEDYVIYKARPGNAKADLTYDRGATLSATLPTETDAFFSILNGNGIGSGAGSFDKDPYKNFFFRLAQPLDSTFLVGGFAYLGKERAGPGLTNRTTMFGGDASFQIGKFELAGQFLFRGDSDPFFLAGKDSAFKTRGGFLQLAFSPELDRSTWYLFLLYNRVSSDDAALDYHSVAGNFSYILARNLKIMGEYAYDLERKSHAVTVGFVTAF